LARALLRAGIPCWPGTHTFADSAAADDEDDDSNAVATASLHLLFN